MVKLVKVIFFPIFNKTFSVLSFDVPNFKIDQFSSRFSEMWTEMLQYESAIINEILLAKSDNVLHPEFPNTYTPN